MVRLIKVIGMFLLVLTLMPLTQAHASPYYYRWDSLTNINCSLTQISFDYARSWNVPESSGEVQWAWYVNGTLDESGTATTTGSGTTTGSAVRYHNTPPAAYPYTATGEYITVVDGEPVYRSVMAFSCPAAGPGTAEISNVDLTTPEAAEVVVEPSLPGPDMVALPDGSVVGTFTTATALYYAPQTDAATDTVMEAGKTLWVTGLDASGQFYQVVLSGQYLWVPAGTLGPTYDDVWNGTPLPTGVVE